MQCLDGQTLRRESVEVRRQRVFADRLEETLTVTSFHERPVTLEFRYGFGCDFGDIFEVRGLQRRRHGELLPVERRERSLTYAYDGIDGGRLTTRIEFSRTPEQLSDHYAVFQLTLQPRLPALLHLSIAMLRDNEQAAPAAPSPARVATLQEQYQRWREGGTRIVTSNEIFNGVLAQSLNDLRTLWNGDESGGYLSAGTPRFDTLFGRDSVIASLQTLAFNPAIARQTLRNLAASQGQHIDRWRDEEPGKILHERRRGEMARTGEVPFGLYFGSVDATPLFLLLVSAYWEWTADTRLLRELQPAIDAALDWVAHFGDRDGDGYLEYERHADAGLLNQGWKDSGDAIVHRDGSLAPRPIALVEVQGYLHAAKKGLGRLAAARRDTALAARMQREAEQLKRRINRDFWLDEGFYALALDGEKQPVASITSNPGHLLFSGVPPAHRAGLVVERLLNNDMFSGWGIRTLSTDSQRFNPPGYDLGTVWPHDNAITAVGFKKYGKETELNELATALFDAARAFDYGRLPELFCGTPRSAHHSPVPYPVACRPQAWAAGTIPFLLHAILGLCPDASRNELLIVRPQLPSWLEQVQVRNLRVGNASADLLFEQRQRRTQVAVLNATAGLRVSVAGRWPR